MVNSSYTNLGYEIITICLIFASTDFLWQEIECHEILHFMTLFEGQENKTPRGVSHSVPYSDLNAWKYPRVSSVSAGQSEWDHQIPAVLTHMYSRKVTVSPHHMTAEYSRGTKPWEIVLSRMTTYKLYSLLWPNFRQHFIFYSFVPSQVYCGFHGKATSQHWSIGKVLEKFGRPLYKTTIFPVLHHRLNILLTGDAHSAHCKEAFHSQVRASSPQGLL